MAAPTLEESDLIKDFRDRVSDLELYDDSDKFLVRWIRARNHDLQQAEDMLRKHINWYAEYNIDTILSYEPSDMVREACPSGEFWKDAENCPGSILPFGKWDFKKVYTTGYYDDFIRFSDLYYTKMLEAMKGFTRPDGVPVTQFNVIYDFEGFSIRQLTSPGAIQMHFDVAKRFEANFPETLKACYIINAPRAFPPIFALLKPLLSERTASKIQIYDCDASKWKPVIQNVIPYDVLPVKYGGRNKSVKMFRDG